jgi:hypothetical protein
MPNSQPQSSAQPNQTPMSLADKLMLAQSEAAKWDRISLDPNLSLPATLAARSLARSSWAAATLYQKAADYQAQENDRESQAMLMRALGISPLLQDRGR